MAGHTKNQYRSVVSQMFDLAAAPAYRQRTGVLTNPFRGAARDRGRRRTVALSIPEIQAWLSHCSRHVGLAMTIAALAPKLRVSNILQLRWMNTDPELTTIIVKRHKTAHRTNRPLVVTISQPLRRLLQVIRQQQVDGSQYVITYRGGPVASIRDGVRMAAIRAGIAYGRDTDDGATFHTIRHSLATMLARLARIDGQRPLSTEERMQIMGHTDAQTTHWYTHLSGEDEIGPSERIGAIVEPFIDVATTLRRRALTPAKVEWEE
jgi:integrase